MGKGKECLRNLAEASIRQAAEDLYNEDFRNQSIDFFCRGGFLYCARLAEMAVVDQVKLLWMLKALLKEDFGAQRKFSNTTNIGATQ